jgi:Membrane domain of glycerophosphoryl diester phosphodiesterase
MATILRPLSTGELLDRTFYLYRKHFTLFVGIVALPNLAHLAFQIASGMLTTRGSVTSGAIMSILSALVYLAALAASQAGTIHAISQVHLDQPATVTGSLGAVSGSIVRIVLINIGIWIGIGIGFVLLIIPGIILALMWALTIPVAVLEDRGLRDSAERSAELTKGTRGRIFVVGFLFVVLMYIFTMLWEGPLIALLGLRASAMRTALSFPSWYLVTLALGSFATQCLVGPLLTIALSLIYYDQRVRKEGFDLQLMMSNLQSNIATAGAGQ